MGEEGKVDYIVKKNGKEVGRVAAIPQDRGMPDEVFVWIQRHQGQSVSYALKYGGYSWEKADD
jgi:hypothetical protein